MRGTLSSLLTVRQRLTHLLTEQTFLVVPNAGVTSLMAAGVHQASLVGPAAVKYSEDEGGTGWLTGWLAGWLYLS